MLHKHIICTLRLLLCFIIAYGGWSAAAQPVYAIKNVNVIPMTIEGMTLPGITVVVEQGKITSLNGPIPDGAYIIDGKGKWLIPGLIDMHVHVPVDGHFNAWHPTRTAAIFTSTQDVMTPFVANGVTTIFDLNSRAGHFGQRNEILRGGVIGPRMALAAMINGGGGDGRIANTPADGRQSVRMAKAEGYEFIKLYSQLSIETYKAIIEEAAKLGMKVVGHIPNDFRGKISDALGADIGMVAHAEELFKQAEWGHEPDPAFIAQIAKANGTWLTPTLVIIDVAAEQAVSLEGLRASQAIQYVHPLLKDKWLTANNYNKHATAQSIARLHKMIEFNKQLVVACKDAGVPIVAGTDAGSSGVVWGFSLHDELELLVDAGLSPSRALNSATQLPAIWLGIDSLVGTIEKGKLADLVLLDANPLEDIRNTKKIAGVFVNGLWLDRSKINDMLAALSSRNQLLKTKYKWSDRGQY